MSDVINLVCLPFAGGGALAFRRWQAMLGERVRVLPVVLPGHETLFKEDPILTHEKMMEYLCRKVIPLCQPPFALYGHSMGSRLAFELARELRHRRLPGPVKLLISGAPAPRYGPPRLGISAMDDAEFEAYLRRLGGTPEPVLQHRELLEVFLPVLRADFLVAETYRYLEGPPLDCPIVAWGGRGDIYEYARVAAWTLESRALSRAEMVDGGHFFIFSAERQFLGFVSKELCGDNPAVLYQSSQILDGGAEVG